MSKVIVLIEFADKDDIAKRYRVGDELVGFEDARIKALIERGLAGVEKAILTDIDMSGNYQKIVAEVKVFEDIEKLTTYLDDESKKDKPRESVVKAIEERLAILSGANKADENE